jgi:hypothetical protein
MAKQQWLENGPDIFHGHISGSVLGTGGGENEETMNKQCRRNVQEELQF